MGVRGGIGLGVGGYSPPGNDVVVCRPEGLADMRLPWACKTNSLLFFFPTLFNCTAKPLHNGHLGGRRKWPWQRGGHDRKVLTRVNVHVSTVHQKSGRYNRKVAISVSVSTVSYS